MTRYVVIRQADGDGIEALGVFRRRMDAISECLRSVARDIDGRDIGRFAFEPFTARDPGGGIGIEYALDQDGEGKARLYILRTEDKPAAAKTRTAAGSCDAEGAQ